MNPSHDKKNNQTLQLNCWFCLGNKEIEKNLIVYVGKEVYIALAKGNLTPYHVIIIPFAHLTSLIQLPESVLEEINKIKVYLIKIFKTLNLRCAFYERNFKTPHFQIHCLQVPSKKYIEIKDIFLTKAKENNINLNQIPPYTHICQIISPKSKYFYVEFDDGEKLFANIEDNDFPINFGREVFCHRDLLNQPEKADWKSVILPKDEEREMVRDLREMFAQAEI
ncbi:unnamed protein product [Gordionus sp. m RMFG-2023]|uniref:CWF19-like protein 1 n=1 Tax=Gordionus sp. m RMFG-2023 TaxID=3053472 RepID=UPI0030DFBB91